MNEQTLLTDMPAPVPRMKRQITNVEWWIGDPIADDKIRSNNEANRVQPGDDGYIALSHEIYDQRAMDVKLLWRIIWRQQQDLMHQREDLERIQRDLEVALNPTIPEADNKSMLQRIKRFIDGQIQWCKPIKLYLSDYP